MKISRPIIIVLFCFVTCLSGSQTSFAAPDEAKSPAWEFIKEKLFKHTPEIQTDNIISLNTPKRAENAAFVPVRIQANFEQTDDFYIKKIYLVVDNNPSPIVGTFTLSRLIDLANLSTRIRVNSYSYVRAVAETSDGKLHMVANFVKASGGCSAPAAGDSEEAAKRRGKMKLRQKKNQNIVDMQFMISHPNNSGLQIDQLSRHWIPADYVTDIKLVFNDEQVLSFTGGISMSENPSIRFHLKADKGGQMVAEAKDSQGRAFSQNWAVTSE